MPIFSGLYYFIFILLFYDNTLFFVARKIAFTKLRKIYAFHLKNMYIPVSPNWKVDKYYCSMKKFAEAK